VSHEPDWSSPSLLELLEKTQEFAAKAYPSSLSTLAFLERALDKLPQGTKGGAEIAELMSKALQVQRTLVEIQQSIRSITQSLSQE
jgi:hypothetical protein